MNQYNKLLAEKIAYGKIFECIRVIDHEQHSLHYEYKGKSKCYIPPFEYGVRAKLYHGCMSTAASRYKIEESKGSLLLIMVTSIAIDDKKFVLECISNLTGKISMHELIGSSKLAFDTAYQLAFTDELTDLYNQRYVKKMLPVLLADCHRQQIPLSILFMDLDDFKNINDLYGHLAGDYVLRAFSQELKDKVKGAQVCIARYGGDEFLLCLSGVEHLRALQFAETIRQTVEQKFFLYRNFQIRTTCSLGVYTVQSMLLPSVEEVLDIADARLYAAKHAGGNLVR